MTNLIKCPGCGRSVSPRAAACPSCGEPLGIRQAETVLDQRINFYMQNKYRLLKRDVNSATMIKRSSKVEFLSLCLFLTLTCFLWMIFRLFFVVIISFIIATILSLTIFLMIHFALSSKLNRVVITISPQTGQLTELGNTLQQNIKEKKYTILIWILVIVYPFVLFLMYSWLAY